MVLDKSVSWYLAGPMTGYPQYNIPAFDAAAWCFRAQGLNVVNPAELDAPRVRNVCLSSVTGNDKANEFDFPEILLRDLDAVRRCGGMILLKGWEHSKGARMEAHWALELGHQFALWYPPKLTPVFRSLIARGLAEILQELGW